MHFLSRYLEENKTFGGLAGLDTIELPSRGLLSGLLFKVWGSCGTGAADPDSWLWDRLTKVELIVNGSQVVKSYSGEQILAHMFYQKTPLWSHDMKNNSGASCEVFFHINLGRHYHDLEYLLDLSKVNDPQIRLTYAFAQTSHHGWTNGTAMTATPSRSVIADILVDTDIVPKGYIKTSELYRFTSGVSKKENMNIPTGPVYSNLYLQSWYASQGLGVILDKLSLVLDSGGTIPFNMGPNELAAYNLRQYGLFKMSQQLSAKGGQVYPMPVEQGRLINCTTGAIDARIATMDLWANYCSFPFRKDSDGVTAVTGNVNIIADFEGIWPFSIAAIPGLDPWDERFWLDTNKYGNVAVRVEETSSASTSLVLKLLGDEVVTRY